MKALDSLSVYICSRLRQRAHGKLPSFPRPFVASSSCFEVFLNCITNISFHFILQKKATPSVDMCNFLSLPPHNIFPLATISF